MRSGKRIKQLDERPEIAAEPDDARPFVLCSAQIGPGQPVACISRKLLKESSLSASVSFPEGK